MSNKKLYIIIGGLLGIVFLLIIIAVINKGFGSDNAGPGGERINLEFWGVYDDPAFYRDVISDFNAANPNIRVNYRKFAFEEYERQLLDAFAAGRGPDIWLIHNTWLARHGDKIIPLSSITNNKKEPIFTLRQFRDQFVDVTEKDLVADEKIFALPVYVDTLGLFYNREILNSAGITRPPPTWEQLNDAVKKITQLDARGSITRSAVPLGTAANVDKAADILSAMFLQSGLKIVESPDAGAELTRLVDNRDIGEVALQYYTDFANPRKEVYTWNDEQDDSINAFRSGKAAMMINYSHQIQTIRAQDPRFNFAVAPLPQISESRSINYSDYWAPTVAKSSKNPAGAWQFVMFLSSKEGASKYVNASRRPPARRDLIDIVRNDPDLGPFAVQSLSAVSWYQADNLAAEKIFTILINDINFSRRSIKDALRYAESQLDVLNFNRQP